MAKILIPQDIAQEGKDFLIENGYEIKMGSGFSKEDLIRDVADCEAVLVRTAVISSEVIEAGKNLKVISRHGVGYDNVEIKRAEELGIWVTNAPESNAGTVAEHTLIMMGALAKNIINIDNATRNEDFAIRTRQYGVDMAGKVLGVAGVGKIGSIVAKRASLAFGMKVIGYDPYLSKEKFPEEIEKVDKWIDLISQADFISLHLPGTEETNNIVGKAEFNAMKESAFLINCARGSLINEEDLVEALKSKKIAGAGLDVLKEEPHAKDNPLFTFDNVIFTPHCSSNTRECSIRMAVHAAMGIHDVLSGKSPQWLVNHPENPRK